ncbi:Rho Gtpase-Activating Protein 11A [Manis pentadactyla]|nr:Rho Gtpase-Activating Protein 11A [Manis pentadactyla]
MVGYDDRAEAISVVATLAIIHELCPLLQLTHPPGTSCDLLAHNQGTQVQQMLTQPGPLRVIKQEEIRKLWAGHEGLQLGSTSTVRNASTVTATFLWSPVSPAW